MQTSLVSHRLRTRGNKKNLFCEDRSHCFSLRILLASARRSEMGRGCRYPIRPPVVLDLSKLCSTVSPGMIEPSVWGGLGRRGGKRASVQAFLLDRLMMPCIRDPVVLGLSLGFGGCKAICIEPDPRVSLIFKQLKKRYIHSRGVGRRTFLFSIHSLLIPYQSYLC